MNLTSTSSRSNRATTQQPTTTHTEAIPAGPHPAATPDTRHHAATHRDRDLDPRPPAGGPTSSATPRPRARRRIFPLPPACEQGQFRPPHPRRRAHLASTQGHPGKFAGSAATTTTAFWFFFRFVCAARLLLLLLLSSLLPPPLLQSFQKERGGGRRWKSRRQRQTTRLSLVFFSPWHASSPSASRRGRWPGPGILPSPSSRCNLFVCLFIAFRLLELFFSFEKRGKFGGALAIFLVGEKRSLGLVGADDASKVVCLGGFLLICSFTNSK